MTIYELRELLKKTPIDELPLRCATYSRVSTEKETQAASLINMTDDFRAYIDRRPNWRFAKAYIDDGKSGLSTKNRDDFLRMLEEGATGEYDLLVTGEISRFGRNTLQGLQNIQYLKERGIPVLFLYDDLNTYDPDCDILIQQKLVDAENESHKISKRVKRGHQRAIQKGHVLGNRIIGYTKKDCRLTPDAYAPMVKLLFELYATGRYSMKQLEDILYERQWRNTKGKRFSHTTLANIIANPKYKGWFVGHKIVNDDLMAHHRTVIPEEEWISFKDESGLIVPPLVSEELWEAANLVLRSRSIDVKSKRNSSTHQNTYTGKIYCAEDGAPYYLKDANYKGRHVSRWVCSHKVKHGAGSCPSVSIYEDKLNEIVWGAFQSYLPGTDSLIAEYARVLQAAWPASPSTGMVGDELRESLAKIDLRQETLLDLRAQGGITADEYKRLFERTREQREALEKQISEIEETKEDWIPTDAQFVASAEAVLAAHPNSLIDRTLVDRFVERIDVRPLCHKQSSLEIRIYGGQVFCCEI